MYINRFSDVELVIVVKQGNIEEMIIKTDGGLTMNIGERNRLLQDVCDKLGLCLSESTVLRIGFLLGELCAKGDREKIENYLRDLLR